MTRTRSRLIIVGAVAALALTGCSAVNTINTTRSYSASDGVRVELGPTFTAENLLVISAAEGEPGALIGGLTNSGPDDVRVTIAADGADDRTVQVPAGITVLLGTDDEPPLEISTVAVPPGAVLPFTISTPGGGSELLSVPVLDGTLPQYAALVPTLEPTP